MAGPIVPAQAQPHVVSICAELARHLPAIGTAVPNERVADLIASNPASHVRLDVKSVGGLSMRSTYVGSLGCQRNELFQGAGVDREPVPLPLGLAGGEGALCGGDTVRLGSIDDAPMLLEERSDDDGAHLDVFQRVPGGWTQGCRMTVGLSPHYAVTEQDCSGPDCRIYGGIGAKLADRQTSSQPSRGRNVTLSSYVHHGRLDFDCLGDGCTPSWEQTIDRAAAATGAAAVPELARLPLAPSDRRAYEHALQIAERDQIDVQPLPHRADEADAWFYDSAFLPVVSTDGPMLGKIGFEAGPHSASLSTVLLTVYRLDMDALKPHASFRLNVVGNLLASVAMPDPGQGAP